MGCQYFAPTDHGADSFTVAMPKLTVGRGTLREAGERAVALGMSRVALFTDPGLANGPLVAIVSDSLRQAGIDVVPVAVDKERRSNLVIVGHRSEAKPGPVGRPGKA